MHAHPWPACRRLGLSHGDKVLVTQGEQALVLPAREDSTLAPTVVRIAAGHPATSTLGAMFGPLVVEKA
jgi:NADH-quinone oxidoreductase subunit G